MLILLFADNYTKVNNQILFYIYFLLVEDANYPKKINFTLNVSYLNKLRILDPSTEIMNCIYNEKNDDILKYYCNGNVNGDIETITPNYNFRFDNISIVYISPLGNYTFYNLLNNTDPKYSSSEIIILNNSTLSQNVQTFSIKGKIKNNKYDFNNVTLRLYEKGTGEEKNVSCTTSNKDINNYELQCKSDQPLVASINNTLGEIQDENGKYLLIVFGDGNNELLNINNPNDTNSYEQEFKNNQFRYYNKNKGLSAGAIIGIIIPCALVFIVTLLLLSRMLLSKVPKTVSNNNNLVETKTSEAIIIQK